MKTAHSNGQIYSLSKTFLPNISVWLILAASATSQVLAQADPPVGTPPATQSMKLENPLKIGTINELLEAILGIVIVLATPVIVFFIIYAGFLYVTARGNPEQIKQASQALTYAVIGGVIILGSFAIAEIVGNLVSSF